MEEINTERQMIGQDNRLEGGEQENNGADSEPKPADKEIDEDKKPGESS